MAQTCKNDGCGKAAEVGKDTCPLCQFRAKDGDPEFNEFKNRI